MKSGKFWAIVSEYDLVGFEFGDTAEEAVRTFARKHLIPKEEISAIPAEKIRDDVYMPGHLISALEYGPEMAFGPEESSPRAWEEYRAARDAMRAMGVSLSDVVGWVRVDSVLNLWSPVVM